MSDWYSESDSDSIEDEKYPFEVINEEKVFIVPESSIKNPYVFPPGFFEGPISTDPGHPSNDPKLMGVVIADRNSSLCVPFQIIWIIYGGRIPESVLRYDCYERDFRTDLRLIKCVENMPEHFKSDDFKMKVEYIDKKFKDYWVVSQTPDDWYYERVKLNEKKYLKDTLHKYEYTQEFQKWYLAQEDIEPTEKVAFLIGFLNQSIDEQITSIECYPKYGEYYIKAKESFEKAKSSGEEEVKEAESSDDEEYN